MYLLSKFIYFKIDLSKTLQSKCFHLSIVSLSEIEKKKNMRYSSGQWLAAAVSILFVFFLSQDGQVEVFIAIAIDRNQNFINRPVFK